MFKSIGTKLVTTIVHNEYLESTGTALVTTLVYLKTEKSVYTKCTWTTFVTTIVNYDTENYVWKVLWLFCHKNSILWNRKVHNN